MSLILQTEKINYFHSQFNIKIESFQNIEDIAMREREK